MRLGPEQARARFQAAPVARLATADAAGVPHLVPVTFALDHDMLYFAIDHKPKTTQNPRRLRNIEQNPHVSALVDHYTDDWDNLWWARADGHAEVWSDASRCDKPIELLKAKYRQYAERPPAGPVVAIAVHLWSGWAFKG